MGQFSQALKVDPAKAAQILAGIELAKRYGECKWQVGLTPADRTLPIVRYVPLFPRLALREAGLSAVNRVLVRGARVADTLPLSLDQIA